MSLRPIPYQGACTNCEAQVHRTVYPDNRNYNCQLYHLVCGFCDDLVGMTPRYDYEVKTSIEYTDMAGNSIVTDVIGHYKAPNHAAACRQADDFILRVFQTATSIGRSVANCIHYKNQKS